MPKGAVSLHVLFEENRAQKFYRTSVSCHIPGRTVAAHTERWEAGASIREAFIEVERQLEKYHAMSCRKHPRTRTTRQEQAEPTGDDETIQPLPLR